MNKAILCGRLTRDPEVRWTQNNSMQIARYSLAVDRPGKDKCADFINCVAFDKRAEFADKYLMKGMKILVEGSIHTDSYEGKDGKKVYTTEVIVNSHEFVERRGENEGNATAAPQRGKVEEPKAAPEWSWMNIPDAVNDEGLPWN